MSEIISKTIKITADKIPPSTEFIESEIRKLNLEPVRWAIVDINNKELTLNVSALK